MHKIQSNWTQKLDLNMTFLGRPGELSRRKERQLNMKHTGKTAIKKGYQGALDGDLRTFVVKEKNPKDPKKPKIELNPEILSYEAQVTTYAEAGPARNGRFEPWQFDEKNHYIYCGLHRNYYQDSDVANAVDNDEHNMPYQRKKRHEPALAVE